MADSSQDKHLPPTARRLDDARKDGNVPRSRDLGHLAVLASGLALVDAQAAQLSHWLRDLLRTGLHFDVVTATTPGLMTERLNLLLLPALGVGVGLAALLGLVSLVASIAAGGWVWTLKPLMPDFSRINPLAGIGRLISKAQIGEMLKACLLALLLGVVGAFYLKAHLVEFMQLQSLPLPAAFAAAGEQLMSGLWLMLLVLVAFSLVDVPLQRFMHKSRLKMSLQEVKDEHKQQDGNPQIKGRIKARMREMAQKRMLAAVPKASLVVMNPTHYAVALRYDDGQAGAPTVVAKGADLLALKIRDIARDAKVPVLESPPLARALYAHAEVDREIPLALYSAVAQVLAYVFQLRAALIGRAPMPGALPSIPVPAELDPHNQPASDAAPAADSP
ncbi:MAG: flagellar biosynthesis protein FlhB [Leptothrix sp. (in: b-proteobacteria)]